MFEEQLHQYLKAMAKKHGVPLDEMGVCTYHHWSSDEPMLMVYCVRDNPYDSVECTELEEFPVYPKNNKETPC
jgi:hypothetical protein